MATVLDYQKRTARSIGDETARGFAWLALVTVIGKAVAIGGQIVLAWLLTPEDFGLIALAYSVSTLANILLLAGQREVLVHRQASFQKWANPSFWMSLVCGVSASLLMLTMAVPAAGVYGRWEVVPLLAILALWSPLATAAIVPSAKLQSQMRFRLVALISLAYALGQMALTIMFAWIGFGVYSFVLPWPIMGAARLAVLLVVAPTPLRWSPEIRRWKYIAGHSLLVLGGRASATAVSQWDYMALGIFYTSEVVGYYYFAFNLSMQTLLLLATSLDSVLFPSLSKLKDEPLRQRQGFVSAARALALVGVPLCFLQAALAQPVMRLAFSDRWESSVPVVQILSVAMAFRLLSGPSQSLLMAQGRFRGYMTLNILGLGTFVVLVTLAAQRASAATAPVAVAAAAGFYFICEGPVSLALATRGISRIWKNVADVFAVPTACAAIAVLPAVGLARIFFGQAHELLQLLVISLITALLYLPAVRVFAPEPWAALSARIHSLWTRGGDR